MSLPRPIVAYLKQVSEQKNPFGPRCKLHHVFFTHLAEVRLSGATYKVAIQVLCASFHLGPYLHVSQCLGRKAVVEELRQAVAKGFLNEEFSITTGAEIDPVAGGATLPQSCFSCRRTHFSVPTDLSSSTNF